MALAPQTHLLRYEAKITLVDEQPAAYINVDVYGEANYENAKDLWQRIALACEEYGCFKILGENHFITPISTIDAWKHQEIFMNTGLGHKARVAWVDRNPVTFQNTEFIGQVLSNRVLINGRLFRDKLKAKRWLLSQ